MLHITSNVSIAHLNKSVRRNLLLFGDEELLLINDEKKDEEKSEEECGDSGEDEMDLEQ